MNYFELLELEQRYNIDYDILEKQYLTKQALYHPDRSNSESSRRKNLDISIKLNNAYKILKDDYLRAEYLLKLLGEKFNDRTLAKKLTVNELEDIMESHEELDSILTLSNLQIIKKNQMIKKTKFVNLLTKYFDENNTDKALDITIRLKYISNLIDKINIKIRNAIS